MSVLKHFAGLILKLVPAVALATLFASSSSADIAGQLGAAAPFTVLGLAGSTDNLSSGGLVINGLIGVGQGATAMISSGLVNGSFIENSPGEVTQSGGENVPVLIQSLAAAQTAATNLANFAAAAALTPTQTFSSITSAMTITGNGGENVILVNGSQGIHLSGGTLTISGGPSDYFIIDVTGSQGIQLSGNTNIVLQGVAPNQVLWYVPSSASNAVQTSGQSDTVGVFLVPNGGIQINGGMHTAEFIGGGPISFQSNPQVSPVPEPASVCMGLSAAGALVWVSVRRAKRKKTLG